MILEVTPQTRVIFQSLSLDNDTSVNFQNMFLLKSSRIVRSMQSTTVQRSTLALGARGAQVTELQNLLRQRINFNLTVDGLFGEETEGIVKAFQFVVFLPQDGIVGSLTWAALNANKPLSKPVLRRGNTSEDVRLIQDVLMFGGFRKEALGFDGYYFGALDGNFGSKTEAAVKSFQSDTRFHPKALVADGVVGETTWIALSQLARQIVHIAL
jgi:peptidoglycan hydrolase-like protein with peptidoglycan-binding domain